MKTLNRSASRWNLGLLFGLLLANAAMAGYDEGMTAYNNKQYAAAMTEWRPLAEQGDAASQFCLGLLYANGYGVTQDYAQAAVWYRKSADQGYASAQLNLGNMYANGRGMTKDLAQAATWFRKAADQGKIVAQRNLGKMYAEGQGVTQDYTQAASWYRKAAEQGDASAQLNIGHAATQLIARSPERGIEVGFFDCHVFRLARLAL